MALMTGGVDLFMPRAYADGGDCERDAALRITAYSGQSKCGADWSMAVRCAVEDWKESMTAAGQALLLPSNSSNAHENAEMDVLDSGGGRLCR
ncbi:MAG TPA: hypothetical protein DEX36_09215 [Glutamicibacter sp.]|nr:hypothetical protein [Glutamicibacter sp.]